MKTSNRRIKIIYADINRLKWDFSRRSRTRFEIYIFLYYCFHYISFHRFLHVFVCQRDCVDVSQRLDVAFRTSRRKWNLTVVCFALMFRFVAEQWLSGECSMRETASSVVFRMNRIELCLNDSNISFIRIWKLVAKHRNSSGRRLRNITTRQTKIFKIFFSWKFNNWSQDMQLRKLLATCVHSWVVSTAGGLRRTSSKGFNSVFFSTFWWDFFF